MKTLFAILVMMTAIAAKAETPIRYVEAAMKVYYVEDLSPLADLNITTAKVSVDTVEETITLTLNIKMPACTGDLACVAVMPEPVEIVLGNLDISVDECGTVTYEASEDNTYRDGLLEVLTFMDNTRNTCPTTIALPKYQANYYTQAVRTDLESNAMFISYEPDFREYDNKVILPVEPLEAF